MKREYAEACPPLLKDFLYYMETIRGRSPRTVDGYFIDLRTFLRYIKAVKVLGLREFDLSEITIDDLDSSVICGVTLSDIYVLPQPGPGASPQQRPVRQGTEPHLPGQEAGHHPLLL